MDTMQCILCVGTLLMLYSSSDARYLNADGIIQARWKRFLFDEWGISSNWGSQKGNCNSKCIYDEECQCSGYKCSSSGHCQKQKCEVAKRGESCKPCFLCEAGTICRIGIKGDYVCSEPFESNEVKLKRLRLRAKGQ